MDAKKIALDNQIYRCISGSKSYGLDTPESDTDIRGLFIPPMELLLDPFQNIEQYHATDEDTTIYSLEKFLKLACNCNPNVIELLFVEDSDVIQIEPVMHLLKDKRDIFLTQKALHSFSGYAMSQLKRIKGHNRHLGNPQPEEAPHITDYTTWIRTAGTVSTSNNDGNHSCLYDMVAVKLNAHTYMLYKYLFNSEDLGLPLFIRANDPHHVHPIVKPEDWARFNKLKGSFLFAGTVVVAVDEYKAKYTLWKDYWAWKNNRNEKRAALEEAHGYDTKHGMHLIRLLKMGVEIMSGKGLIVKRTEDEHELRDIRRGRYSYAEVVAKAEKLQEELDKVSKTSSLPDRVDEREVAQLYSDMVSQYHASKFPNKGRLLSWLEAAGFSWE